MQDLQVVAKTTTSISLSWTPPVADAGTVTDYEVTVAPSGSSSVQTLDTDSTSGAYTISGLTAGEGYDVTVAAVESGSVGAATILGGAVSLSAGPGQLCATDDVGQVTCWGRNDFGQRGDGTTSDTVSMTGTHPIGIGVGAPASSVSVGDRHVCALMVDTTVRCWGNNHQGQLGDGTFTDSDRPMQAVGLTGAVGISTTDSMNCAALGAAGTECWGGLIGNGGNPTPRIPADMAGLAAYQASSGFYPCVVDAGGQLTCHSATASDSFISLVNGGVTAVSGTYATGELCGLVDDGTVRCAWGLDYAQPVNGIEDATQVSANTSASCAVQADGTVGCWGWPIGQRELYGEVYPENVSPVSGLTDAVAVSVSPPGRSNETGEPYACAALATGAVQCWGAADLDIDGANAAVSSDLYTIPAAPVFTATAPSAPPAAPTVTAHPSPTSATLSWPAPKGSSGDAITDYRIQTEEVGSDTWSTGQDQQSADLSGGVTGLIEGDQYRFRVEAYNDQGWGDPSAATVVTPALAGPLAPTLSLDAHTGTTATVSWTPPSDDGGEAITGYDVQVSSDGGATWHNAANQPTAPDQTTATVTKLSAIGTAYLIRVCGINAAGVGEPSNTETMTTAGTSSQQLTLQTSSGQPISGGLVSWQSSDGSSESAQSYVTNADGVLTFPQVVPGEGTVQITGGLLPDGSTVSGDWDVLLGTDPQTLSLGSEPTFVTQRVHVSLPNGVPVLAAAGTIEHGMSTSSGADGFDYTAPGGGVLDNVSGDDGTITFTGYLDSDLYGEPQTPTALIEYDDGTLIQKQSVSLTSPDTDVQLAYMPWVTVGTGSTTPTEGSSVAVNIRVRQPNPSAHLAHLASGASSSAGVRIRITPPAGTNAKACHRPSKLAGSTSASGKLALRSCASRSGVYQITTHGAVPAPGFLLLVKGAPPLAPRNVLARSYLTGSARLSWAIPLYSGGAHITSYIITATAKGKRPIRVVHHGSLKTTIKGLSRFALWTFHVSAVTIHGTGTAATTQVRIS